MPQVGSHSAHGVFHDIIERMVSARAEDNIFEIVPLASEERSGELWDAEIERQRVLEILGEQA